MTSPLPFDWVNGEEKRRDRELHDCMDGTGVWRRRVICKPVLDHT